MEILKTIFNLVIGESSPIATYLKVGLVVIAMSGCIGFYFHYTGLQNTIVSQKAIIVKLEKEKTEQKIELTKQKLEEVSRVTVEYEKKLLEEKIDVQKPKKTYNTGSTIFSF